MERALEEVGVSPTVISTADQISGALPLVHSGVTVIKVNGDYLDARIRNTTGELSVYDDATNTLLDRIFDEFGLIVCGWSADWDVALRTAIERCPSRRFTTFWTTRTPLSGTAETLAKYRRAEIVEIKGADEFFGGLAEKVSALEDMKAPHPLSAKMAAAMMKRYLIDPTAHIKLHDLVQGETQTAVKDLVAPNFPARPIHGMNGEVRPRIESYRAICSKLVAIAATGCYWCEPQHIPLWVSVSKALFSAARFENGGYDDLLKLRRFPVLLSTFSSGLSAVAKGRYDLLHGLLTVGVSEYEGHTKKPIILFLAPTKVVSVSEFKAAFDLEQNFTPISDYLCEILFPAFCDVIPDKTEFEEVFDRFEYLYGLIYADLYAQEHAASGFPGSGWGPIGRFRWRANRSETTIWTIIGKEVEELGENWPPLRAGMFGNSLVRLKEAKAKYDAALMSVHWY